MGPLPFKHQHVQRLRRLSGRRSARAAERAFVIEGPKVIGEAIDAGIVLDSLFVAVGAHDASVDELVARVALIGTPTFELAAGVIERVADAVSPQPVIAIAPRADPTLSSLEAALRSGGFAVVAIDVRDPGNVGTIIRSTHAAGGAGVVLCDACADATNPKAVRASAGALFHVPVVATSDRLASIGALRSWGVRTWATVVGDRRAEPYDRADLRGPTAFVVGSEAHGLREDVVDAANGRLTIPMAEHAESLNVSMAATVLCFEAARQRRRGAS